jgi:hypothetical protein
MSYTYSTKIFIIVSHLFLDNRCGIAVELLPSMIKDRV